VNDDSSHHRSAGHQQAWADLAARGYALTSDRTLGLPEKFRENFRDAYFNSWTLRQDEGDRPVDRQRARDVVQYRWRGDELTLQHYDSITITDRAGIPGKREHARVELLKDAQAKELIRAFLWLVPPKRRQADGTFGVNLFRTFTNVVTSPHHDNEEFIIIYVVDRVGEGAETRLYRPGDVAEDGRVSGSAVLEHQLNPGDLIIFEDKRYMHDASALVCPPGGRAMRDALVCTVDHRSTYLAQPEE
jgi:hypothetical protein